MTHSLLPEPLRDQVRLLGDQLGNTILEHHGPRIFNKIEEIRGLSKSLAQAERKDGAPTDYQPLVQVLDRLPDAEVLPIARAFNQFLNLANIAEQHYFQGVEGASPDRLGPTLAELARKIGKDALAATLPRLRIELVLTAHPTEVTRRTLIQKYDKIAHTLSQLERCDLTSAEMALEREDLARLIEEIWHTNEIRDTRPSALDEAKWGFAVIEHSLWNAVPAVLRHLDRLSLEHVGQPLPPDCQPLRFFSWMGGDRDGNPNVTSSVTQQVLLLGRRKAAEFYLRDVTAISEALSMSTASAALREVVGSASLTPYRDLLGELRLRLRLTQNWAEQSLLGTPRPEPSGLIRSRQDLLKPLLLCHESLHASNLRHIASGPLLDLIRLVQAFGINLLPLDIRQHSERHAQALDEACRHLELGSYLEWPEQLRLKFLLTELQSRRPLLPRQWQMSEATQEVLATCHCIAEQTPELLSHYVISMTTDASDILAVVLLLKECGVTWQLPIVPLFETLDDLRHGVEVMTTLWALPWYRQYCGGRQTVMIGYSDSAKDAGKFAATWAQYCCQEALVEAAAQAGIKLHLFHGRGGTIGRGGGPVEKAMASQPPGSVQGSIRVTEQGEMIRYKFGLPSVAFHSLNNYLQATLLATLDPAPQPIPEWRALMERMSDASLATYRAVVVENPDFVRYFRSLTPEQELNKLALGSRPAKRKLDGGIDSLRAIPWVFAWTQVRLNLPGWLGVRQALEAGLRETPDTLFAMQEQWPFFSSFLDLIEMLLGKCDGGICAHYEAELVEPSLHGLGRHLREDLDCLILLINKLKQQDELLDTTPLLQQSIDVRKPYVDPLNYLQAELLKRERRAGSIAPQLERALKVTMSGIAAGMRNTG
jgi:phosphoenolpyruvate carboxylase